MKIFDRIQRTWRAGRISPPKNSNSDKKKQLPVMTWRAWRKKTAPKKSFHPVHSFHTFVSFSPARLSFQWTRSHKMPTVSFVSSSFDLKFHQIRPISLKQQQQTERQKKIGFDSSVLKLILFEIWFDLTIFWRFFWMFWWENDFWKIEFDSEKFRKMWEK